MKKNVKFLIGGLIAVVLVVAIYFGNAGGLFQGKISLNDNVTKAELAKLLTLVMTDEVGKCENPGFTDVQPNDWYYDYVCYLSNKGIVKGYADGTFGVNKNVSRAEAAKLFVEVFDKAKKGPPILFIELSELPVPYSDVSDSNQWYFLPIYRAAKLGIVDSKGFAGARFFPNNPLTKGRAQYWTDNLKKALNK